MDGWIRRSPVVFNRRPLKSEKRDHWEVPLCYEEEGPGPFLVDLSHVEKWDVQDHALHNIQPGGRDIPESPGACFLHEGMLITRLNGTQGQCWALGGEHHAFGETMPFTDITEALALFALIGRDILAVMEGVTSLDLASPLLAQPCLFQGPVLRVPSQVVVLGENGHGSCVLVACSRGYGQSMADALLEAGRGIGLSPAGEKAFSTWLQNESHTG